MEAQQIRRGQRTWARQRLTTIAWLSLPLTRRRTLRPVLHAAISAPNSVKLATFQGEANLQHQKDETVPVSVLPGDYPLACSTKSPTLCRSKGP